LSLKETRQKPRFTVPRQTELDDAETVRNNSEQYRQKQLSSSNHKKESASLTPLSNCQLNSDHQKCVSCDVESHDSVVDPIYVPDECSMLNAVQCATDDAASLVSVDDKPKRTEVRDAEMAAVETAANDREQHCQHLLSSSNHKKESASLTLLSTCQLNSDHQKCVSRVVVSSPLQKSRHLPQLEKFVKVEDAASTYRPSFMQNFPQIDLNGDLSKGIFKYESCSASISQYRSTRRQVGMKDVWYCECCDIFCRDMDLHIQGRRHKMFVASEANYAGVDEIIEEIGQFVVKPAVSPDTTNGEADLPKRRLVEYSSTDVSNAFYFCHLTRHVHSHD